MENKEFLRKKFAIATATAKKAGYSNFKKGGAGYEERKHIAESENFKKAIKKSVGGSY